MQSPDRNFLGCSGLELKSIEIDHHRSEPRWIFARFLPQCRQGIGRSHAGPDIIYEGEILDLLVQRRRDKARVVKLMGKTHRPGRGLWTN